jgi:hypothetical protein
MSRPAVVQNLPPGLQTGVTCGVVFPKTKQSAVLKEIIFLKGHHNFWVW